MAPGRSHIDVLNEQTGISEINVHLRSKAEFVTTSKGCPPFLTIYYGT